MSDLVEVKKIGEVERIVHGSGLWDGTGPVEFSDDGTTWVQAWAPTDEHAHPLFARVEVFRKDVRVPTTVTIRWDEQYPAASEEWAGQWDRSPMRHFGRTARMVGFRQTFRELLGNIVIEDEDHTDRPEVTAEPATDRDWVAEFAAADTEYELDALDQEARRERVFTADAAGTALHVALRRRRREIRDRWADGATAWDVPPITATIEVPEAVTDRPARPVPQDHLPPANRAARRKAARKKGGKR